MDFIDSDTISCVITAAICIGGMVGSLLLVAIIVVFSRRRRKPVPRAVPRPEPTPAAPVEPREEPVPSAPAQAAVKSCASCGAENPVDNAFCEYCGAELK